MSCCLENSVCQPFLSNKVVPSCWLPCRTMQYRVIRGIPCNAMMRPDVLMPRRCHIIHHIMPCPVMPCRCHADAMPMPYRCHAIRAIRCDANGDANVLHSYLLLIVCIHSSISLFVRLYVFMFVSFFSFLCTYYRRSRFLHTGYEMLCLLFIVGFLCVHIVVSLYVCIVSFFSLVLLSLCMIHLCCVTFSCCLFPSRGEC